MDGFAWHSAGDCLAEVFVDLVLISPKFIFDTKSKLVVYELSFD